MKKYFSKVSHISYEVPSENDVEVVSQIDWTGEGSILTKMDKMLS